MEGHAPLPLLCGSVVGQIARGATFSFDLSIVSYGCMGGALGLFCNQPVTFLPINPRPTAAVDAPVPRADLTQHSTFTAWRQLTGQCLVSLPDSPEGSQEEGSSHGLQEGPRAAYTFELTAPTPLLELDIALDPTHSLSSFAWAAASLLQGQSVGLNATLLHLGPLPTRRPRIAIGFQANVTDLDAGTWLLVVRPSGATPSSSLCFSLNWRVLVCDEGWVGPQCQHPLHQLQVFPDHLLPGYSCSGGCFPAAFSPQTGRRVWEMAHQHVCLAPLRALHGRSSLCAFPCKARSKLHAACGVLGCCVVLQRLVPGSQPESTLDSVFSPPPRVHWTPGLWGAWFPLPTLPTLGEGTSSNASEPGAPGAPPSGEGVSAGTGWAFLELEVPTGATGGVLSFSAKRPEVTGLAAFWANTSDSVNVSVIGRRWGVPSVEEFDVTADGNLLKGELPDRPPPPPCSLVAQETL